jgi:hypothetical protein
MKSVLAFLDLSENPGSLIDRICSHISMGDALFFVHDLPKIDDSLLPLIGDLKEIRKNKIKNQLSKLRTEVAVPLSHFETIVIENGVLDFNGSLSILNQGNVLLLDQKEELIKLDKSRFNWIEKVKTPIQTLNLSNQVITLKA